MVSVRVLITQPLIPHYRLPLFRGLAHEDGLVLRVCASETVPHARGLQSHQPLDSFACVAHDCVGLMGNRLFWQKGLGRHINLGPGDVLVICGNPRYLSNVPFIWQAKKRGAGVVWWAHGFSKRPSRFRTAIRRMMLGWCDVILLYTDAEVERYAQAGFPRERLFATNNAIDQTPIRDAIAAWPASRLREFQQREGLLGAKALLFCGRLATVSRLELTLRALSSLKDHELIVIGSGPAQGPLQELADDLGVGDRVRWLGAMYDQSHMAPWFLSARCSVYPAPIGLSIFHSYGYGLPVITHDNLSNQNPEIAAMRHGENGLLFKEGDVTDLVAKIRSITENDAYRRQLSERAMQTVQNEYSMDSMVDRFKQAVLAASKRTGR